MAKVLKAMTLRILHSTRAFLRPSRSKLTYAPGSRLRATSQCGLASDAHSREPRSDTPWIIGSALLFGPTLIYLLGPRPSSHENAHKGHHPDKHGVAPAPITQRIQPVEQIRDKDTDIDNEKEMQEDEANRAQAREQNAMHPEAFTGSQEQQKTLLDDGESQSEGGGADVTASKDITKKASQSKNDDDWEGLRDAEIKDVVQQGVKPDAPKVKEERQEK